MEGDKKLSAVVLKNTQTGELREVPTSGVFVFIGLSPNTQVVRDLVDVDAMGFVVTDGMLATSVLGIFAAGDCREGSTHQ